MLLIVVIIVTVLMTTGVPEFHKQEVESDDDAEGYHKQVERGGGHFSDGEQNRQTWEDRNIRLRINANRAKKGANPYGAQQIQRVGMYMGTTDGHNGLLNGKQKRQNNLPKQLSKPHLQ